MNIGNLTAILALINKAIETGGELLPIALRAYAALKDSSGMTDEQFTEVAMNLNPVTGKKIADLIAETGG